MLTGRGDRGGVGGGRQEQNGWQQREGWPLGRTPFCETAVITESPGHDTESGTCPARGGYGGPWEAARSQTSRKVFLIVSLGRVG